MTAWSPDLGSSWMWDKGRRRVRRDGAWRLSPWESGALIKGRKELMCLGGVVEFVVPMGHVGRHVLEAVS